MSARLPWVAVEGVGVWAPGFADGAAFLAGTPQATVTEPAVRLPPRLRRRASLLVRMAADVAMQAAEQAEVSLTGMPVVMGSAYGELVTTMELLNELEVDRLLSPFRFHNSVHNTAAGYLSMATENQASCSALAAGNDTVPAVFLEALAWLADRGGRVLAIVADEPLPEAIARRSSPPVAAALVLAARGDVRRSPQAKPPLGWLGELRQQPEPEGARPRPAEIDCPSATVLGLVAALAGHNETRDARGETRVNLSAGENPRWSLALRATEPA